MTDCANEIKIRLTIWHKLIILFVPLLMTSCHAKFTGPLLWRQGSTGAFDLFLALWLFDIAVTVITVVVIYDMRKVEWIKGDSVIGTLLKAADKRFAALLLWLRFSR
jgi:hypothetical protein